MVVVRCCGNDCGCYGYGYCHGLVLVVSNKCVVDGVMRIVGNNLCCGCGCWYGSFLVTLYGVVLGFGFVRIVVVVVKRL